jgi:Tfp pilus assembly protein FimT
MPPRNQRGLTMTGFLFVAAVVVVVVMLALRIAPAVIEYYAVKQALEEAITTVKDPTAVPDVQRAFQRRIDAGYIESVTSKDVQFSKEGNTVIATVAWTRTMHLVANASLLLEFEAVASR